MLVATAAARVVQWSSNQLSSRRDRRHRAPASITEGLLQATEWGESTRRVGLRMLRGTLRLRPGGLLCHRDRSAGDGKPASTTRQSLRIDRHAAAVQHLSHASHAMWSGTPRPSHSPSQRDHGRFQKSYPLVWRRRKKGRVRTKRCQACFLVAQPARDLSERSLDHWRIQCTASPMRSRRRRWCSVKRCLDRIRRRCARLDLRGLRCLVTDDGDGGGAAMMELFADLSKSASSSATQPRRRRGILRPTGERSGGGEDGDDEQSKLQHQYQT